MGDINSVNGANLMKVLDAVAKLNTKDSNDRTLTNVSKKEFFETFAMNCNENYTTSIFDFSYNEVKDVIAFIEDNFNLLSNVSGKSEEIDVSKLNSQIIDENGNISIESITSENSGVFDYNSANQRDIRSALGFIDYNEDGIVSDSELDSIDDDTFEQNGGIANRDSNVAKGLVFIRENKELLKQLDDLMQFGSDKGIKISNYDGNKPYGDADISREFIFDEIARLSLKKELGIPYSDNQERGEYKIHQLLESGIDKGYIKLTGEAIPGVLLDKIINPQNKESYDAGTNIESAIDHLIPNGLLEIGKTFPGENFEEFEAKYSEQFENAKNEYLESRIEFDMMNYGVGEKYEEFQEQKKPLEDRLTKYLEDNKVSDFTQLPHDKLQGYQDISRELAKIDKDIENYKKELEKKLIDSDKKYKELVVSSYSELGITIEEDSIMTPAKIINTVREKVNEAAVRDNNRLLSRAEVAENWKNFLIGQGLLPSGETGSSVVSPETAVSEVTNTDSTTIIPAIIETQRTDSTPVITNAISSRKIGNSGNSNFLNFVNQSIDDTYSSPDKISSNILGNYTSANRSKKHHSLFDID